jgi:hypothetical protein
MPTSARQNYRNKMIAESDPAIDKVDLGKQGESGVRVLVLDMDMVTYLLHVVVVR